MRNRIIRSLAVAAVVATAFAGCASGSGGGGYGSKPSSSSSASGTDLSTAKSKLGTIVVDGKGMTVYVFDKDTKGTTQSACTGACSTTWPAVTTSAATPAVSGVTGTVATIQSSNGGKQVTLDGWPLYTYSGDSGAGQTSGQGIMGIWWVVSPSGSKIMTKDSGGGY